jgi:hypothetical protein
MEFIQLVCRKGILLFLFEPILQDNLVNDFTAENTSPSEKLFTNSVEFFEYHFSSAPMALHGIPPLLAIGPTFSNFYTNNNILLKYQLVICL